MAGVKIVTVVVLQGIHDPPRRREPSSQSFEYGESPPSVAAARLGAWLRVMVQASWELGGQVISRRVGFGREYLGSTCRQATPVLSPRHEARLRSPYQPLDVTHQGP
ncbi:hypothetical protein NEUTE2DRAFT_69395 [Neurospora tetrasperma FGSC 2509]|nr:hypothetical protein NEUTE2DRAFT_69395 [Neurospora tetrasperma FGSC 2509]